MTSRPEPPIDEPDPTPDDYCDWCDGSPCVCDRDSEALMDDIYERSAS